jgi:4-aminobutyrate aminotransferase-like enzyme/Ser/Thr protein kinase RdoA (MazF antagonist)
MDDQCDPSGKMTKQPMKTDYSALLIGEREAEKIVRENYGIEGIAEFLPGEIDINFKIRDRHQRAFVLKISRPNASLEYLDFQQQLLTHLAASGSDVRHPEAQPDLEGHLVSQTKDDSGRVRCLRLLSWIPGRIYSQVNPKTDELRKSLGRVCGTTTAALQDFQHPMSHRPIDWDVAGGGWISEHLHLFPDRKKKVLAYFLDLFRDGEKSYVNLRKSVVHNDANDYNLVVTEDLLNPKVLAVIDFGDAVCTQVINDLAVAGSYALMGLEDPLQGALPLVRGYHEQFPILEEELEHLYYCIGMRLAISVTKSALNRIEEPENTYLQISDSDAWELLFKWKEVSPELAHYSFRSACGYPAHPNKDKFFSWAKSRHFELKDLFPGAPGNEAVDLDLSVGSPWLGLKEDFADFDLFDFKISELQKVNRNKVISGGYLEARGVYATEAYDKMGNSGKENRTIHLGVDFWLPAGTPVHAMIDGEVVVAVNDPGDKEYGGLVILRHQEDGLCFYTLYGHLTVASATRWKPGDRIERGERIAVLGDYPENGNWPSHLHFQVMLSMLGNAHDFPGVGYFSQIDVYRDICPDPNAFFKLESLSPRNKKGVNELISLRKKHLGQGMSLSYDHPLHMVRGSGAYLIDSTGRKYLDTVNNVAHVGHEHVKVVRAGQAQMALLNTNTRYLHQNIIDLAEELRKTLPDELSVFHFVNSGSEANELALRMIKTATGRRDILASEAGYHGNTNACIEVSSYKFEGKGGQGCPEHTHIFPLPDSFRGKHRGPDSGVLYAGEVEELIKRIHHGGRKPAGLIIEPIISCGGQVELPRDFLKEAYKQVREAGGYCISDEVQVGCGRLGKTFWGFELHGVIPDIITIGKPLGNGHPIAAVVCTKEVAEGFSTGMEFFNTFGGNPVSCAIGTQVLRTVREERLQENALSVGEFLKKELQELTKDYPIVGDVRGQGLFLGVELVDRKRNPLSERTAYLVNRMKAHGVLMSLDGPDHNVLKIKPPLVFSKDQGTELIELLQKVLNEEFMQL